MMVNTTIILQIILVQVSLVYKYHFPVIELGQFILFQHLSISFPILKLFKSVSYAYFGHLHF